MKLSRLIPLGIIIFGLVPETIFAKKVLNRTVVTVNNDIILESDLKAFSERLRSKSFQELFGGVDPKVANDRKALIQLLIDETIINQQVKKLELTATDQEVDGQIRAIATRNGISTAQLNARLRQLGTTLTEYKAGIKRQLERKELVNREIRPNVEISEEQLKRFYLKEVKGKGTGDEYKIAHILIAKKGLDKDTLNRANKIWDEVSKNPDNFSEFVKEYSDDAPSIETHGELGFFSEKSLTPAFRKIIPTMAPGTISKPIKTDMGYHILKLLETRKPDLSTLPKEQQEKIEQMLYADAVEKKMSLWLERKKREAYIKEGKPNENQPDNL